MRNLRRVPYQFAHGEQLWFDGLYTVFSAPPPPPDPPEGWVRASSPGVARDFDEVIPVWLYDLVRLPGSGGFGPHLLVDHFSWHHEDREFVLGFAAVVRSTTSIASAASTIAETIKRVIAESPLTAAKRRLGSATQEKLAFMSGGRWGYDPALHGWLRVVR